MSVSANITVFEVCSCAYSLFSNAVGLSWFHCSMFFRLIRLLYFVLFDFNIW